MKTCFKNQQINVNHNPRNPEIPTGQGLFTPFIIEIVIGRTVLLRYYKILLLPTKRE